MRWGWTFGLLAAAAMVAAQESVWERTSVRNQYAVQRQAESADVKLFLARHPEIMVADRLLDTVRGGMPWYLVTFNREAADTHGTDELWPGGNTGLSWNGTGLSIGIWDGGIADRNHLEFLLNGSSRITAQDGGGLSGHATQVSGTIMATGIDAEARGAAFAATLRAWDFSGDVPEMYASASTLTTSNHSYGYVAGWVSNFRKDGKWAWLGDTSISTTTDWKFGFYTSESQAHDDIAFQNPTYLPVFAAGNSRGGPTTPPADHWFYNPVANSWALSSAARDRNGGTLGYDSMPPGGQTAKNTLSVGAVFPIAGGYAGPASVSLLPYSSFGPTDDGRIKPDLVAAGTKIYTTFPGNQYGLAGGTSLAAPSVTGVAAMLAGEYRRQTGAWPLSSTIRALLIHTADPGSTSPGPNYRTGWGLLNARQAGLTLTNPNAAVLQEYLAQGQTITRRFWVPGGQPFRVTLAWTDPAANPNAPALNDASPRLINDLNVRVSLGSSIFSPYVLNPASPASPATTGNNTRDNVEQVLIPNPAPGLYTVTIQAAGATLQPSGTQSFSLVATGVTRPTVLRHRIDRPTVAGGDVPNPISTVTLTAPAWSDLTLPVRSDNPAGTVPASVTIPANQSTVSFSIATRPVVAQSRGRINVWLNDVLTPAFLVVDPALANAVAEGDTAPASIARSTNFLVRVSMRNTGNTVWSGLTNTVLGSVAPSGNTFWGLSQVTLPPGALVFPGQTYPFEFTAKSPAMPGSYRFQWRMRRGTTEFGDPSTQRLVQVL